MSRLKSLIAQLKKLALDLYALATDEAKAGKTAYAHEIYAKYQDADELAKELEDIAAKESP